MTTAPVRPGPANAGGPAPVLDVDEYLADIGDRIRAERQARGWTQTHLGHRAGISLATVKRLENGLLGMRALIQACMALEVQPDRLLSGEWRMPAPKPTRRGRPAARMALSPRQAEVLREAASGDSLKRIGSRLGMDSRAVGAALSQAYQRLGVAFLPSGERRAAAVRVASDHGMFDAV